MSEDNDKQLTEDGEATGTPTPSKPEAAGQGLMGRESFEFRQELLSRLPTLAVPKWQPQETLNVYQDLQGIVDLDADAFLQPLESIAEKHHD
jgi:hypothetical protein